MKNTFLLLLSATAAILTGCYEDLSNAPDKGAEIITIEGIEPIYNISILSETLTIDPTVTSTKEADWEYSWGVYETNVQGAVPKLDTICVTKELSTTFNLTPKKWILVFSAKNKLTGYQAILTSELNIITPFSAGWFILKDDGAYTDVDMFAITNSVPAENPNMLPESFVPVDNIISRANGRKLNGTGLKASITDLWRTYNAETEMYANTRVYVFVSSDDFVVAIPTDMSIVREPSNLSYDEWTSVRPNFFFGSTSSICAGFDGKMYSIGGMVANTGRFGVHKVLDNTDPDYSLSNHVCLYTDGAILFDNLTSSFIHVNNQGGISYSLKNAASAIDTQNNNLICHYMGFCNNEGFGIFEDKTNGKKMVLNFNLGFTLNIRVQSVIEQTEKAYNGSLFTAMCMEHIMFFVGEDGNVYSRTMSGTGKTERMEYETPPDETVTFLRNQLCLYSTSPPTMPSYLAIATSTGGGESATYKIGLYTRAGGSITGKVMELTGSGYARDIMNVFSNSAPSANIFFFCRYL